MESEPTTDEVISILEQVISDGAKGEEFSQKLKNQIISQLFYVHHTFDYPSIEDALHALRELTEEIHLTLAGATDGFESLMSKR